jgi:hypothetical protein
LLHPVVQLGYIEQFVEDTEVLGKVISSSETASCHSTIDAGLMVMRLKM